MRRVSRVVLPGVILCAALAVLWRAVASLRRQPPAVSQQQGNSAKRPDLFTYLPPGATIVDEAKSVAFADLDADGQREEVIFYSLPDVHSIGVVILKKQREGFARFWEKTYDDSLSFADPSGVYDLNGRGKPQLFVYRTIGASCPGVLHVFEIRQGKVIDVTGPWANNGACQAVEISDLDHDGKSELIVKTRGSVATTSIYAWSGSNYVRQDERFARYYENELAQSLQYVNSPARLPLSARLSSSIQAVRVLRLQRRYAEAIQLLEAVLIMIDNPDLTSSNTILPQGASPEQQQRLSAWFDVEKLEAKSTIHRLLGDTNKAAGDHRGAQKEYTEADSLQSQAKEYRTKIPT